MRLLATKLAPVLRPLCIRVNYKHVFRIAMLTFIFFVLSAALFLSPVTTQPLGIHFLRQESTHKQLDSLKSLVNSAQNKRIFSKLLHSLNAFYDHNLNVVGTLDFNPIHTYQTQPYVANGFLGSRIPNLGHGYAQDLQTYREADSNGWPLFNKRYAGAFAAGFYDLQPNTNGSNFPWLNQYGGESVISSIPQWTTLTLSMGNKKLDPAGTNWGKISDYVQNMSYSDGLVTTSYLWQNSVRVTYRIVAHRLLSEVGVVEVNLVNEKSSPVSVKASDVLDGASSHRTTITSTGFDKSGIYLTFTPSGLDYVHGIVYSKLLAENDKKISFESDYVANSAEITLPPKQAVKITKVVAVVTSDLHPHLDSEGLLAHARSLTQNANAEDLFSTSALAWADVLGSSLSVSFPDDPLLTLTARASIYHLLANTRADASGVTSALSVTGLSSDSYGGMVFWDTDLWMLTALLPFNPGHARSLVNYRKSLHDQARDNIHSPLASKTFAGAAYPWTSGRFGNCTGTGPCFDYEYHLNAAVAHLAWQVYLSGAGDDTYLRDVGFPLIDDAARLMASYVEYNDLLGKFTTANLTDPDEYANHIDNGAYTNAAISALIGWARRAGSILGVSEQEYFPIERNMFVPISPDDYNLVLEYLGMQADVGIKQADVIMMSYPLENELLTLEQARANMDFYSSKQVSFGPAMTFPIFSVVSLMLLSGGCASQSYLQKAVQPFLRGPFAQFSEQNNDDYGSNGGTHPAFPFLTAHGGFLQAILQGFLGLRFEVKAQSDQYVRVLKLDPLHLATLPRGFYVDGIHYMNRTLSFNLTADSLHVSDRGIVKGTSTQALSILIETGERIGSREYILKAGSSVLLPLYRLGSGFNLSITECGLATITNITCGMHGDATVSVNDGDNSTHWQAAETVGKLLFDLKEEKELRSGFINWGNRPPLSVSVYSYAGSLELIPEILAGVDFGNDLHKKFEFARLSKIVKESSVFHEVYSREVDVTAPYNATLENLISVVNKFNVTELVFPLTYASRFYLICFEGLHDDTGEGGAKIHEIALF